MTRLPAAYGLAAPLLCGTLLLVLLPALGGFALLFFRYDALAAPEFVGVENLKRLASDPLFRIALRNSLIVALASVPLRVGLALLLSLLVARRNAGARTLFYLPIAIPDVAWALLWLWLLNPVYGPLAWALRGLGIPGDWWLTSAGGARGAIVLITLLTIGEMMIVLAAARREIGSELYEVCALEGASAFTTFRKLTLPLLAPAIVFLACRDFALSLQTTFVPALIVTEGGPNYATTLLPLYIYQNGFEYLRFGYASAMTLAMFGVTLAMVLLQVWVLKPWLGREA